MLDFSFDGVSLSSFGGRMLQPPSHQIAARNKSFVKIYGQSGDEIIDNQSYNNVPFSLKICFLPFFAQQTAQDLARAVIDWLAPLQDGYYIYRDSLNDGYFTKAALTNFEEITRELPTLLTATLKFSRVPFWYKDSGATAISLYTGSSNSIINPEAYPSEPLYRWVYERGGNETANITVNGVTTAVPLATGATTYYLDNVCKQFYRISDNQKIYLGSLLLPDLKPGTNTVLFNLNGSISSGSFHLEIIPNWRRL